MLYKALLSANPAMVQAVARQAVDRYAGMEAGRPVGGTYYLYRTLRNLDLDKVMDRLVDQARRSASSHIEEGDPRADAARRRPDRPRGAAAARRVPGPDRPAAQGDRGRDPPAAGRRPGERGAGQVDPQAAARGHRRHARHPGRARRPAQVAGPAVPQARRPPRPQAAPRPQGTARLPLDHAPRPVDRRGADGPEVPLPPAVQARDHRHRRHLGVGGLVRPVHPPPGPRHQLAVLQGAQLRLHRRHRRGDRASSRASTTRPRPSTGSTPRPTWSGSTGTPTTATP